MLDSTYPPATIELHFVSNGERLNGHLYQANGPGPHPTVVLLHGFPGNEKNLDTAQVLRRGGFNVLFFHYRGAWGSEGDYRFTHVYEDVSSAVSMLQARAAAYRVNPEQLVLLGHSLGGFAALQAASREPGVACVATLAAADLGVWAEEFGSDSNAAAEFKAYSDGLQMLADYDGNTGLAEIAANADAFSLVALGPALAGKSVLLIAALGDDVVPIATHHAPMLNAYRATPGLNVEESLLAGDHSFSWSRHELNQKILDWASGCAGSKPPAPNSK